MAKKRSEDEMPRVSVAITNWNGKSFILKCLGSIAKLDYPKRLLDVMVVDNASIDGSIEAIEEKFPWVRLFKQKQNIGFSAGMNVGLRNAKGKYVLILNNDEILDRQCLRELVKVMAADKEIGMAGAKIYSMDDPDVIQSMWGRLDRRTMHVEFVGSGEKDKGQYEDVVEADYVSFSSLVRCAALEKIGYLDERYFYSFEDTDLMLRLKMAGYKLVFVPKAKIWHKGAMAFGSDSTRSIYFLTRNNLLIRKKFNGINLTDHWQNLRFFLSSLWFAAAGDRKKRWVNLAVTRAIWDFYRGRFGNVPF